MKVALRVIHNGNIYTPVTLSGVNLTQERKGMPSKLEFDFYQDTKEWIFTEGDVVTLKVDGKKMFKGYLFRLKMGKEHVIRATAYDQLRYLKNKDTMMYTNMTVGGVIRQIAAGYNLQLGEIEDPGYNIAKRLESSQTLFDIIQNAQDLTLINTGILSVLYDDFGLLTLKNVQNMQTNVYIDASQAVDFAYETSIDSETYNRIKLTYDNSETGVREIYIAQDSSTFGQWGILQYMNAENDNANCAAKADQLLKLYNKKHKSLSLQEVKGSTKVRAGSSVYVKLNLGDVVLRNMMLCERVVHRFEENYHAMNLELNGNINFYS